MAFDSLGITNLTKDKYLAPVLTTILLLYASMLGPSLPNIVKVIFNNVIFKILILFFLVVRGNNNPTLSIITAVAFVLTLEYIALEKTTEQFQNIETFINNDKDSYKKHYKSKHNETQS
jgi:hypothetical protein